MRQLIEHGGFGLKAGAVAAVLLASSAWAGGALAQSRTDSEVRQAEDAAGMRRRNDAAASAARNLQDNMDATARARSDARDKRAGDAAYEVFKAEESVRLAARLRAADEARSRDALEDYARVATNTARNAIDNEPERLAAVREFESHPPPVPAPGSFTECDRLAAWERDPGRPPHVAGVPLDKIDGPRAVAACQAEIARSPETPRPKFELGRALMATHQCNDAMDAWAKAGGSYSAAKYMVQIYTKSKDSCSPGEMYDYMVRDDLLEKSGPVAYLVADQLYQEEAGYIKQWSDAHYKEHHDRLVNALKIAVDAYRPLAESGDYNAIELMADLAYRMGATGIMTGAEQRAWVFRCLARHNSNCSQYRGIGQKRGS